MREGPTHLVSTGIGCDAGHRYRKLFFDTQPVEHIRIQNVRLHPFFGWLLCGSLFRRRMALPEGMNPGLVLEQGAGSLFVSQEIAAIAEKGEAGRAAGSSLLRRNF
jgi:hypothetical protein